MSEWFAVNLPAILVGFVVFGVIFAAVAKMALDYKKNQTTGGCGGCLGCSAKNSCFRENEK